MHLEASEGTNYIARIGRIFKGLCGGKQAESIFFTTVLEMPTQWKKSWIIWAAIL